MIPCVYQQGGQHIAEFYLHFHHSSRFDIVVVFVSLSRYRAQPRKGHLSRGKRIFGYLAYLPGGAL